MFSLTDPPGSSPIAHGVDWLQAAALGTAATVIAVVAVAAIGLMMLSGRFELRRGVTAVIGCFILFGASSIATALTGLGGKTDIPARLPPGPDAGLLPQQLRSPPPTPAAYDPYAGASVPTAR